MYFILFISEFCALIWEKWSPSDLLFMHPGRNDFHRSFITHRGRKKVGFVKHIFKILIYEQTSWRDSARESSLVAESQLKARESTICWPALKLALTRDNPWEGLNLTSYLSCISVRYIYIAVDLTISNTWHVTQHPPTTLALSETARPFFPCLTLRYYILRDFMPRKSTLLKVTSPSISCPSNKIFCVMKMVSRLVICLKTREYEGWFNLTRKRRISLFRACRKMYKELSSTIYESLRNKTQFLYAIEALCIWIS